MQVGQCLLKRSKESGWGRAPLLLPWPELCVQKAKQSTPDDVPAPEERGGDRAGPGQTGWKLSVLLPQPSPDLPRLHRTDPNS